MAVIYDYIVHVQVTRKDGAVEEWRHPVQAYTIQDATFTAIVELDAEHDIAKDGTMKLLSVRPDAAKIAETTRTMIDQASREISRALNDATAFDRTGLPIIGRRDKKE